MFHGARTIPLLIGLSLPLMGCFGDSAKASRAAETACKAIAEEEIISASDTRAGCSCAADFASRLVKREPALTPLIEKGAELVVEHPDGEFGSNYEDIVFFEAEDGELSKPGVYTRMIGVQFLLGLMNECEDIEGLVPNSF